MNQNTHSNDRNNQANQIHPDDLKRLQALQSPDKSSQSEPFQKPDTQQVLNHDYWDADVEKLLAEKKREREIRRMKAHGRLLAQKRKRLLDTGSVLTVFQIMALLVATLFQRILYDLTRWKRTFDRQPARARGLELIVVSALILVVVGFFFAGEVKAHREAHRGPFLAEALNSPYKLDARSAPFINEYGAITLPASFDDYDLITSELDGRSISQINRCLAGLRTDYTASDNFYCTRTYGAQSMAYGRYMDNTNSPIDIIATHFVDETHADQTFLELLRYSRSVSQVGNFSLMDDDVTHYFFATSVSEFNRWVTFAWQRGTVIYAISAQDSGRVEAAVKAFPY